MAEMFAYCGVDCDQCPAFIATQNDDMEALAKMAAQWTEQFKQDIPVESVLCDGCKSEGGRLSGYCDMCAVRACGVERGVVTCATCDDYGCEILLACPAYEAKGKANLEKMRST
jgi:hypothetical protein